MATLLTEGCEGKLVFVVGVSLTTVSWCVCALSLLTLGQTQKGVQKKTLDLDPSRTPDPTMVFG